MAIGTAATHRFLAVIPDKIGVLGKRMEVRGEHKNGVKLLIESGVISLGGPTLVSHPLVGEEPQINGSVLLLNADTQEEILEIVRQDIYTTSGVWDLQNIRILPLGF
ncbi:YciI family protein [Aspergillus puulaauensis]|uniref:YCII-related domain-containing protein n=1 Tax=Aspergillus puulaauensis TaxID=1220207 RepID=A0A7R8AML2_9EURO|nr:uncharacterized protein APUU_40366A [Aspergillus puulaauensis]BCS23922.1 hypothetical protein APUU_40366A [Aspergillus puulaauensis]